MENVELENYEIIEDVSALKALGEKMMQLEEFAFDTETNTLRVLGDNEDFRLVGISISWGKYNNYYIPVGHLRDEDFSRQVDLSDVVKYLKPAFERENVRIIGHTIKFDMHVLERIGISIKTDDLFDIRTASWLCNENTPNGLKENSSEILGISQTHFNDVTREIPAEIKKQFGLKANNRATIDLALIDDVAYYAACDAFYTWELYLVFLDRLEEENMDKIFYKVYVPFTRTIFEMEKRGVTVDIERLQKMREEMKQDMEELVYQMYELSGVEFNPSSSQQLAELLFGYRKLDKNGNEGKINEHLIKKSFKFPVISVTGKGAPQTSSDVIWKLSKMQYKDRRKKEGVELCKFLIQYKKLEKLYSAFIDGLEKQLYDDDKVHPNFNITGTDSGRLSCSEPNLQQLPKADEEDKYMIRSLFIGSEENGKRKKILAFDYSNLEMRILAHFSEDAKLLEMFANGEDTHGATAVNMFELDCKPDEVKKKYPHLRQAAKTLNFMLMYGGGAYSLYNSLKDDVFNPIDLGEESYLEQYHVKSGEEVAQEYINKYFKTYSGVAKFISNQRKYAHRHGYVYTLLKRKRRLPAINSEDFRTKAYCERLAVNSAVQGSAADIMMSAQNRINADSWFRENGVNMLIQIHDELVFECPEEAVEEAIARIKRYMEHPFGDKVELNLPLVVEYDYGDNYQEAK